VGIVPTVFMTSPLRMMSRTTRSFVSTFIAAAAALIVAVLFRAVPAAQTTQNAAPSLPDTPETALFVRVCVDCHDAERTTSRHRTRAEWRDTIQQMIDVGADASDEEFATVLEWLVINAGAVAINTAKAEDIGKVLGLSPVEAEAIVAYRTAKGNFADLEAVKQVPEIDVTILEKKRNALRF
jgi:competence ComEA-like helix-hairpin-helix protein